MKKYAKSIALLVSSVASGTMLYFAWPILTDPTLGDFKWMILAIIALVFIVYYMLLGDVLKEVL
jgi:hypothetical protein